MRQIRQDSDWRDAGMGTGGVKDMLHISLYSVYIINCIMVPPDTKLSLKGWGR